MPTADIDTNVDMQDDAGDDAGRKKSKGKAKAKKKVPSLVARVGNCFQLASPATTCSIFLLAVLSFSKNKNERGSPKGFK